MFSNCCWEFLCCWTASTMQDEWQCGWCKWKWKGSGICITRKVVVSSDESKLKPVVVLYPRFCNVWFKEYLFSTRGEACKSKKSINCLCFILSFYYIILLLEEMLIFVERSLTEKLWIRGNKNFVFCIFSLFFHFLAFIKVCNENI